MTVKKHKSGSTGKQQQTVLDVEAIRSVEGVFR